MIMKKPLLLACVLALALLFSGCALVEKDQAVDLATPVISIGDIVYTKADILNTADNLYYNYGYYYGSASASEYIDTAVTGLKQTALERYMVSKLGLDQVSAQEQSKIDEDAASLKQEQLDMIKLYYFSESELQGEELDKAVLEMLEGFGYTDEGFAQSAKMSFELDKLRASVTDTVSVSEEEARQNFDSAVASAKESYATDLSAFGKSFNAGTQTYYTPAGYRYVKNLLVKFTDDDAAALSTLNSQITQKQSLITSTQKSVDEYNAAGELNDEQKDALNTLQTDLQTAQSELADLMVQLTAATDTAYANIGQTVAGIRERLAAGEAFDALMSEFNKDTATVNTTTGYAICEGFTGKETAMVEAAMALKAPGDVTQEDIKAANGIQILQYVGDMQEGEVAFDTVKELDAITQLSARQEEAYTAQLAAWEKENPVKVDTRSLKN